MYVVFPVSTRTVIDLQNRAGDQKAPVIKVRLPDGRLYGQSGTLDFVDNSVAGNTDTMTLRGRLPNPVLAKSASGARELIDGELVTVPEPPPVSATDSTLVVGFFLKVAVTVVSADTVI